MNFDAYKLSIIVPAYNVAQWLPRCLDSILAQTYQNLEIIVVDDGSTDDTSNILKQYAAMDTRIKPHYKANGGVTSARLAGICRASGEWVGFVDGDDEIQPNMYERLMENALKYGADISHCGYQMVFPDGRINYFHNTGRLVQQDKLTGLKDLLVGSMIEPGLWNKLFRKTLFHSLLQDNLMDLSIKINEDLLMNFYLFSQAEKSVFEDFCPYLYVVRNTSASRQKLNEHKIYDPIKVKEHIIAAAPDDIQEHAQKAYLNTCINVFNSVILTDQQEYEKDQKNVRRMVTVHWSFVKLLKKKQRLSATMIRYAPIIYKILYRYYATHFLKSPYT